MSIDKIRDLKSAKVIPGDMEVGKYVYTLGLAGKKFFDGLKNGKILASTCEKCGITYLPPKAYCEECHGAIDEYSEVGKVGMVYSYTIQYIDGSGKKLGEGVIWALIKYEGVRGGIVHKLGEVDYDQLYIGMLVEPVFKKKGEREGKITDILYFRPIKP